MKISNSGLPTLARLELALSNVTDWCFNQLNYRAMAAWLSFLRLPQALLTVHPFDKSRTRTCAWQSGTSLCVQLCHMLPYTIFVMYCGSRIRTDDFLVMSQNCWPLHYPAIYRHRCGKNIDDAICSLIRSLKEVQQPLLISSDNSVYIPQYTIVISAVNKNT